MKQREALYKIVKEVGNTVDLANILGISHSYLRVMLCESQKISPKIVKKLSELSNGKVRPEELRPDIF